MRTSIPLSISASIPTRALIAVLIAATLIAGCRDAATPQPESESAPPAATAAPAPTPAPAPTAPAPTAPAAAPGMLPAPGTITFAGFGPAAFGADAESLRMAWGKELEGAPGEPGGCYVLAPAPRGEPPYRFGFMLEGGKFSRIDVRTDAIPAPGGGKVGMSAEQIARLYPDAQTTPHKYTPGARMLRAKDPAGGRAALVFETDADGAVAAWRIGLPPQVDYVESCG